MRTKLKMVAILTLLLVFVTLSGVVNAETTVQMQLTSSSKLQAGATVEVTLAITNINAGDGIDSFIGEIDYDEEVFEPITEDNFDGQNRWNLFTYNEETNLFTLSRSSYVNTNSDVLKVTLKVKEGVTKESAEVSIKDIFVSGGDVASGGTGDIAVDTVSVTIKAPEPVNPGPTNPDPGTQEPDPNTNTDKTPVTPDISDKKDDKKTNVEQPATNNKPANQAAPIMDNSGSQGTIPQTGTAENMIFFTISAIAVMGIVAYIRYRIISKDIK